MKLGLAQINTTVGDLAGNSARILKFAGMARDQGCELVLFPELATTGYPPQDLLFKRYFIDAQLQTVENIASQAPLDMIVGYVDRVGDDLFNAAAVICDQQVVRSIHKTLLPTYDVFDEWRYFKPAQENRTIDLANRNCGITICEDLWDDGYEHKVARELADQGADLLINLSSSPFHIGKHGLRLEVMRRQVASVGLPLVYCNLIGAQDELIFDGRSFVMDASGAVVAQASAFAEDLLFCDLDAEGKSLKFVEPPEAEDAFNALVLGVRDYFNKCGFSKAVIGLSGGVDSALVAVIAAESLGANQVIGVAMPSKYTSDMSNEDAAALAANLGIEFHVMPIEDSVKTATNRFKQQFGDYEREITEENLQARERGKILMEISNDRNALVLSTGNKTEYALGYTTLYGDMCGGLAVIGDVSKPLVYDICRYFNSLRGAATIPERILSRPPSAELKAGQVDPFNYDRIGPLVDFVIEGHMGAEELRGRGYGDEEINRVLRLVRLSEYKRKQAPPVLRITEKGFGIGRRMPIVNHFDG